MVNYKKSFKKYDDDFTLFLVSKNAFIYKRQIKDFRGNLVLPYYEVFKKRFYALPHPKSSKKILSYRYPSDEEFGKWAWCYRDLNKALTKFHSL